MLNNKRLPIINRDVIGVDREHKSQRDDEIGQKACYIVLFILHFNAKSRNKTAAPSPLCKQKQIIEH